MGSSKVSGLYWALNHNLFILSHHSSLPPAEGQDYYVDPNGGSTGDAIAVTCRSINDVYFTCIQPSNDSVSIEAKNQLHIECSYFILVLDWY